MIKKLIGILVFLILSFSLLGSNTLYSADEHITLATYENLQDQDHQRAITSFELPSTFPDVPETMMIYKSIPPTISQKDVRDLMEICHLDETMLTTHEWGFLANEEDKRVLVVYTEPGTGYIRYRDNVQLMSETPSDKLPSENEAIRMAEEILTEKGLLPDKKDTVVVDYSEVRKYSNDGVLMERGNPALYVKFLFSLNDFPVIGPGAKAGVVFGENGAIIGLFRIWRDVGEDHEAPIISPEEAFALFKQRWTKDEEFKQNNQMDVSFNVLIDNIYLAYYTLPGFEPQNFVEPVYVFTGSFQSYDSTDNRQNSDCAACGEPFQIIIPAISK